jgi:thiamine pyrophosphokinase
MLRAKGQTEKQTATQTETFEFEGVKYDLKVEMTPVTKHKVTAELHMCVSI